MQYMNRALNEAALSANPGCDKNNSSKWIILILIFFLFCGCGCGNMGDMCLGSIGRRRRGRRGQGGLGLIIIVIIILLGSSAGFGRQGNVNTNIINVNTDDGFDEDDELL